MGEVCPVCKKRKWITYLVREGHEGKCICPACDNCGLLMPSIIVKTDVVMNLYKEDPEALLKIILNQFK
jgi:hypothetical protein